MSKEDNERVRAKQHAGILSAIDMLRTRNEKIKTVKYVGVWPEEVFHSWTKLHEMLLTQYDSALVLVNTVPDDVPPGDWPEKTPEFLEAENTFRALIQELRQGLELVKKLRFTPPISSIVH